jgi:chromosome segregation ATPase
MANPIKTSDILQDDGAIQSAIDQLKAFEKQAVDSMSKVKEEAKKLKKEMNDVNTTTARGREETEEAAKKTDEIARRYKKYQDSLTETGQEIAALKLAQQQLNQVNKLTAKQNSALEGSYNDLSAQLSLLKIRWKQLSEEERENGEEGKKLTKQIKSVNDELIKLDKSVGVASRKVGSYKEAIEEATAASGSFNGVLNLIRKTNIVEISVQVYEKLEAAFKDPLGSLKEFGRTITTQLTNRLKGTLELVVGLGKAIGNTLVLDFDAAKKAAKEAGEAFIKVTTGLDKEQQDEFIDSVKELTKQIEKEADAFAKLYERQRQVRKVTRALNIEVSELAAQEAILSQKAGDTTLGFEEQKKAAEELETILKKKGETEIKLAKNNLSLINTEIKLRRANKEDIEDLLDTQAQAIQTLKEAETSLTVSLLENARERREISDGK